MSPGGRRTPSPRLQDDELPDPTPSNPAAAARERPPYGTRINGICELQEVRGDALATAQDVPGEDLLPYGGSTRPESNSVHAEMQIASGNPSRDPQEGQTSPAVQIVPDVQTVQSTPRYGANERQETTSPPTPTRTRQTAVGAQTVQEEQIAPQTPQLNGGQGNIRQSRTRAGITVASLNMSGRFHNGEDKWRHMNQLVRENRIGILALQETHLLDEDIPEIEELSRGRLRIVNTIDPLRPNAAGVTVVINTHIANAIGIKVHVLVPGRALFVSIPWHKNKILNILAIYAPNDHAQSRRFWEDIKDRLHRLPTPDVMLGDFNLTEDNIDRLPSRNDNAGALETLQDLRRHHHLIDGWRRTWPTEMMYTYSQTVAQGGSHSRLDRIYIKENAFRYCNEWKSQAVGLHTDHLMVSARISDNTMPFVGKGRWTLPLYLITNDTFITAVAKLGVKTDKKIKAITQRSSEINAQRIFEEMKTEIALLAKAESRRTASRLDRKILETTAEIGSTSNSTVLDITSKKICLATLNAELKALVSEKHQKARDRVMASFRLESECSTSRIWAKSGKERAPRDTISELRRPGTVPATYESRSDKMAALARDYHEQLQTKDIDPESIREPAMAKVLDAISRTLTEEQREFMERKLSITEVEMALRKLPSGKATGLNGIPYELWKTLAARQEKKKKKAPSVAENRGETSNEDASDDEENEDSFDVLAMLTTVFNDIEEHGVNKESQFAKGWLCPLYKKGDKRDIANYRPITLLNSDYKLFTKTLSLKLADPAPSIIHENQAGFVPGRSIADQIRLTQMIQSFSEIDEGGGGIIIGLDQEKAYDKIAHDYLWKALERFNFPPSFINTVRTLYENAETAVMINGELSFAYRVTRGVRQGCPLSCLLFDIAIEPLAEMLRCSTLEGFKTDDMINRIVVTLFADDTTIYLSKNDDIQILLDILRIWCSAATAKFNIAKTEVIPIGPAEYRAEVITSRRLNNNSRMLPVSMNIAQDGEAKRFLGAWIGNDTNQEGVWSPVIDKINSALLRWEKTHPTIEGRRIIIQWIVGGMSQYLTDVQGMPKSVEKQLDKISREFAWDNNGRSLVHTNTMKQPISEGGKKILNVRERNNAIVLAQVRDFLTPEEGVEKPWTPFMKAILAHHAQASPKTAPEIRENPMIQTWEPKIRSLPKNIQTMISTAKTFGVRLDVPEVSEEQASEMPIWSHPEMTPQLRQMQNTVYSELLRNKHQVRTVADLVSVAQSRDEIPDHTLDRDCKCTGCAEDRQIRGCILNPAKCIEQAQKILQNIPDKWNPIHCKRMTELSERNTTGIAGGLFNAALSRDGPIRNQFRVFTEERVDSAKLVIRDARPANDGRATIGMNIFSYGTKTWTSIGNPIATAGARTDTNPAQTTKVHISGAERPDSITAEGAELTAILDILRKIDKNAKITLNVNSLKILKVLDGDLLQLENRGWQGAEEKNLYKAVAAELRKRGGLSYVKRQSDQQAEDLATNALEQNDTITGADLDTLPEFKVNGILLEGSTQASLHSGVREHKPVPIRKATKKVLLRTSLAVKELSGKYPSHKEIWESVRDKAMSKGARGFFWKNLHGAYRLGKKWDVIPGMAARGVCGLCDGEETMEHILITCPNSIAAKSVWALAEKLWRLRETEWPEISFGTVLGCNLAKMNSSENTSALGRNRLFSIIISESAHLIWKIRCERVIKREDDPVKRHTKREVTNKWLMVINTRLKLDKMYINKKRYGSKAIRIATVVATWLGVMKNEENLPDNWVWQSGGLVGIEVLR